MNKLIKIFTSIILIAFLSSCANPTVSKAIADANEPAVIKKFENDITVIANAAIEDPNYKRIPLDSTPDIEWFFSLAFLLWDDKVTTGAFMEEGVNRFPDYKESFEYIAEKINALSK
ncbi:hypothetical protein AADZ86_12890 [Colwelliaceae bacterium BS250]